MTLELNPIELRALAQLVALATPTNRAESWIRRRVLAIEHAQRTRRQAAFDPRTNETRAAAHG